MGEVDFWWREDKNLGGRGGLQQGDFSSGGGGAEQILHLPSRESPDH